MWRKATCYKPATFAALAVASAIATTRIAAAADITYNVNLPVGAGSVTGSITTDGTLSPQFFPNFDIVAWNLTLSDGTGTANLTSGVNSTLFNSGGSLTATATDLLFNFNTTGTFLNISASPGIGCPPQLSIRTAGGSACNGASGTGIFLSAVLPQGSNVSSLESGSLAIGTVGGAPSEIPLPPAIYLFGSVLGGAFWMSRWKRSPVSSLGAA